MTGEQTCRCKQARIVPCRPVALCAKGLCWGLLASLFAERGLPTDPRRYNSPFGEITGAAFNLLKGIQRWLLKISGCGYFYCVVKMPLISLTFSEDPGECQFITGPPTALSLPLLGQGLTEAMNSFSFPARWQLFKTNQVYPS